MANVSLKAPPEPFMCGICAQPEFADKAGPGCAQCPAFNDTHYFPRGAGDNAPDVLVVGDVPEAPDRMVLLRAQENGIFHHEGFNDTAGQILRNAVRQVQLENGAYRAYTVRYVYGVKCSVSNPNKGVITACQGPFATEFANTVFHRERAGKIGRIVIIACGVTGLRSVGVAVSSFEEAAGRVFDVMIGNTPATVVPTMSLKAIAAAVGKYSSIMADIDRAFRAVTDTTIRVHPREKLEANYRYPKSLEDVEAICSEILAYTPDGTPAEKWLFSFDTETNTLHPHRDGTKLLMVSMSWDKGKATAIPLWHPENTYYDPAKAWEIVKRLLASDKPKVLHNAKYDIKVIWKYGWDINNIIWDCMLAEHALEEDKKGQYGLKYLVRQFLPRYSGYEDQLHNILVETEGEDQRTSLKAAVKEGKPLPLPTVVTEALDRLGMKPSFRASTLEKRTAEWKAAIESGDFSGVMKKGVPAQDRRSLAEMWVRDAEVLLAAKAAGEFTEKKAPKAKKKVEGGYESVPLTELAFYAAVDADATRQLAIIQHQRMLKEDASVEKLRAAVEQEQRASRVPESKRFPVVRLCPAPHPTVSLVRNGYVPRSRVLAKMEYGGVKVNTAYVNDAEVKLNHIIAQQEQEIYRLAGDRFNINSSAQLGRYLFDTGIGYRHPEPEAAAALSHDPILQGRVSWDGKRVMYRPELYTERGQAQVNEATLKIYATKYKCALSNAILVYRKAIKARDTFLGNVRDLSSGDGFLHTSYNLNGTGTGRLSSSGMNMQNVPKGSMGAIPDTDPRAQNLSKKEREGVKCKRFFIPDADDQCFGNIDAKGAEVTIFAAYAKDEALLEALRNGLDAHCFFSSEVLNPDKVGEGKTGSERKYALERAGIDDEHAWTYEDFLLGKDDKLADKKYGARLKKLRDNIKRVVFGILFGAGPGKIAEIAGIELEFAKTIIDLLFGKFPSIPTYSDFTKWELRTFGLVETHHGRRRRFSIKNAPRKLLGQAERRAVNFKIQGTNSDIVMDVLTWISPIIEHDFRGRCLLTVHDSIGFQVPKKYAHQLKDLTYKYGTEMVAKANPWLPVPYRWDVEAGDSYGDVMPIDQYLAQIESTVDNELAGYTEEEILDAFREMMAERT